MDISGIPFCLDLDKDTGKRGVTAITVGLELLFPIPTVELVLCQFFSLQMYSVVSFDPLLTYSSLAFFITRAL